MAQASYVPNSVRAHITGASRISSTKPIRAAQQAGLLACPAKSLNADTAKIAAGPADLDQVDFLLSNPADGMEGGMTVRLKRLERRYFIGGSDSRIIMGNDEAALQRLWREKRGEVEPEDLSDNLIVQLGLATEPLNRLWYERNTGQALTGVQSRVQHPVVRWMAATLDGVVEATGAVFEAKFMLPWSFTEEGAAEKHMAQLQHNMWVTNAKTVGPFDHHRRRQMGRNHDPGRSPLPAPAVHGGKEILALRGERRAPSTLRCRAAPTTHRGRPDRRYERI